MKIKASASSFPGQILWEKFAKVSENLCGRLTHTPDQSEDEIVRIAYVWIEFPIADEPLRNEKLRVLVCQRIVQAVPGGNAASMSVPGHKREVS